MKSLISNGVLWLVLLLATGCSSSVTKSDVEKQRDEALDKLKSAQEALMELAYLKEQYSEDYRDAQIEELKSKEKSLSEDIDRVEDVETESAQGAAGDMAYDLKSENRNVESKIASLEKMQRENWQTTREAINTEILQIKDYVQEMTESLSRDTTTE